MLESRKCLKSFDSERISLVKFVTELKKKFRFKYFRTAKILTVSEILAQSHCTNR